MPGAGDQPPQRTTFRPPWVKDGPPPIPMPTAPWTLNSRRDSKPTTEEAPAFTKVTLKVTSKIKRNFYFATTNLKHDYSSGIFIYVDVVERSN